jgi:hypothetical protein
MVWIVEFRLDIGGSDDHRSARGSLRIEIKAPTSGLAILNASRWLRGIVSEGTFADWQLDGLQPVRIPREPREREIGNGG